MKKVFVIDTNVLLSDPNSIFKFEDNDVVIPISVIEEIDHFKKDQSQNGRNAREVSRILDRLRQRGTLSSGIPLFEDSEDSGLLFVHMGYDIDVLPSLLENSTDNHLLSVGLSLQKKFGNARKVLIITKDSNLRIKSDAFGIASEDFEADKVDISHLYTGIRYVDSTPEMIAEINGRHQIRLNEELAPNEFVVFVSAESRVHAAYGIFDKELGLVKTLPSQANGVWGIYARNVEQSFGLAALLDDRIKLVTLTGGAGTGKSLLAVAAGLAKTTDDHNYQKLLVARPIFALGKEIGFLPGDIDEKLNPWMQPIYDSLDFLLSGGVPQHGKQRMRKGYQELIDQGMLSVEPLTYIRGRSLPNSFFIVDESQNLTPHEIKTILTRAGEGTKIVLTGDSEQIDNPYLDSTNCGLTYVVERFKNSPIAAHITFKKGERSELATLAAKLL